MQIDELYMEKIKELEKLSVIGMHGREVLD